MKQQKSWIRYRHRVVRSVAGALLAPYVRRVCGVKADRFEEQGTRPYLILMNHQTPFDQFFVCMSFSGPVYFLATEDIFSKGFLSKLLRWAAAPIPILKSTGDLVAVRNCVRVAREGGTVALAPEGNRTYSGKTEYMNPAVATLARMMKLPVALYRIEGGYGVQPRWSDRVRRGSMRAYVSRVIEPEDVAAMSDAELFSVIRDGLNVNEGRDTGLYESDRRAEFLERAVYVCPFCGLSPFRSAGNEVECLTCRRRVEYGADKRLRGVGFTFPFTWMTEWYDYQCDFVRRLDLTEFTEKPLFRDPAAMYEVVVFKRKNLLRRRAELSLYGDRVAVSGGGEDLVLPFSEVTAAAALGRNRLNLYHGGRAYQFRGGKGFNALKYVNIYYRFRNAAGGDENGEFLGL